MMSQFEEGKLSTEFAGYALAHWPHLSPSDALYALCTDALTLHLQSLIDRMSGPFAAEVFNEGAKWMSQDADVRFRNAIGCSDSDFSVMELLSEKMETEKVSTSEISDLAAIEMCIIEDLDPLFKARVLEDKLKHDDALLLRAVREGKAYAMKAFMEHIDPELISPETRSAVEEFHRVEDDTALSPPEDS